MARRRKSVPTYRKHRSGKAVVTVRDSTDSRREIVLPGKYGSAESKAEYERVLALLRTSAGRYPGRTLCDLTVNELLLRYLQEHAAIYYVQPGTTTPTSEVGAIKEAARPLVRLYGNTLAAEFNSLSLEAVQHALATGSTLTADERAKREKHGKPLGMARTTINRHVDRIKRIFRWACAKLILPAGNLVNLEAVASLKAGRSSARETETVKPVDPAIVERTLPCMAACPADMVRIMLLSGCRVGELCQLRGRNLDRTGAEWVYAPERHKTLHRGHVRQITFGPRAQMILRKYLHADPDAFLFSPAEQDAILKEQKRAARQSKVQPSQRNRSKRNPKRKPGECYDPRAVNHAIRRGCVKAGVEIWHTHRLRHSAALNILREFGIEAARSTLGHKTLSMTLFYAGVDLAKAKEVSAAMG